MPLHAFTDSVRALAVVAWSPNVGMEVGLAVRGSAFRSMASGEGLMCHFEGPGEVWVQTHVEPPERRK